VANTGNRKAFEKQLENTVKEEEKVSAKIDVLNDSILSLDNQILEAQSKAEVAGELGPLKYISKLSGVSMDKIINWFILIIIFVFDPLAISLVIAANLAFKKLKHPEPEQKLAIYNEKSKEETKDILKPLPPKNEIKKILDSSLSTWKKNKLISKITNKKKSDDDIKTY